MSGDSTWNCSDCKQEYNLRVDAWRIHRCGKCERQICTHCARLCDEGSSSLGNGQSVGECDERLCRNCNTCQSCARDVQNLALSSIIDRRKELVQRNSALLVGSVVLFFVILWLLS